MGIWDKVKKFLTDEYAREAIATEGIAIRECIYQEFSKFYNDKDNNKKIVNTLIEMLTKPLDSEDALQITKKNLMQVEIEVFSYCNRKCWFCPNKFIDRSSDNHFMDESVYLKVLSELRKIDYSGIITYSRYNEPFGSDIIFERIRQAREYCPGAFLRTNSNGDFLNKEKLERAADAGLNEIEIQCYLGENETLTRSLFEQRLNVLMERLGLEEYVLGYCNEADGINATLKYDRIHLTYAARNFHKVASNRGGSLECTPKCNRQTNCLVSFKNLYIDWNGNYMLCCNFRSDIEDHKQFILGNADSSSIFDIFTSDKIISFRKLLGRNVIKTTPCNTCNFLLDDKTMNIER